MSVNEKRIRYLNKTSKSGGPILYWMSRDQRIRDNWAFVLAFQLACSRQSPFAVVFTLTPHFLGAGLRQYQFMMDGLCEVETELADLGIGFWLHIGEPAATIVEVVHQCRAGSVVTDFDPLHIKRQWKQELCRETNVEVLEVDAHNIVPAWETSSKLEFAARTIRPKIHRLLPEFLEPFSALEPLPTKFRLDVPKVDWDITRKAVNIETVSRSEEYIIPGGQAGHNALAQCVESKLIGYDTRRNDPLTDGQSGLSPYFHFGQLAPQRAALDVMSAKHIPENDKQAFLEELIVRRELSDNFCLYQSSYDTIDGAPDWAHKTLDAHRNDARSATYTFAEFESAQTHSSLWNAAQSEMVKAGKMHGYMRMYWAKKILEWTPSPEIAIDIALRLNDTYQLDGRDPNGVTGVMWSICGVHDRAFKERPIFGKIRYMNEAGCRRKFDVDGYIARWT
ncbi:deoxyribodipyrimidine photo-lyase [Desulfovibrio inopinatus]|uniref:deoxyribodipyrimidine photo-lyase n=1 Tax=Desulfovibrio inopinatus TaxID=102109 RepID=UPI0004174823|nr:deoxyribodipyrimidine photo-lyase [Desulfovibrio inopinatus]